MGGLTCDGVGVSAESRTLLDGVTLAVGPGSACAVMGRSGAGKSTLLQAIAGLVDHGGRISVDGRDLTGVAPHRRRVGLLFQQPRLFPTLRAVDNVAYPLRLARWARARRRAEAARLLAEVGLADRAQAWPAELSGGEQQRVALARALCVAPAVLLLDEPLTGLDLPQRRELAGLLRRVRAERDVTWMIVTHDPEDAAALGDSIAVLDAGRLVQHGPAADVRARPATIGVAALLGSVNLLRGQVRGGLVRLDRLTLPVTANLPDGQAVFSLALDRVGLVRRSGEDVCLPGVVGATTQRGPYPTVRVDTSVGFVEVVAAGADRSEGAAAEVWFHPADLWPVPGTPSALPPPASVGGAR
ncbi:MAG: ABC transporter ATP-binding protein [Acidimicrobiales bacterium]